VGDPRGRELPQPDLSDGSLREEVTALGRTWLTRAQVTEAQLIRVVTELPSSAGSPVELSVPALVGSDLMELGARIRELPLEAVPVLVGSL
jgi:hypothetical protein